MNTDERTRLRRSALAIRLASVRAVRAAGWGFLGSCLSIADVLAVLADRLQLGEEWETDRDHLVLSKGHAAPALYAAVEGHDGREYAALGSRFQGFPNTKFNASVTVSTGSLGNGLPVALGLRRGLTLLGRPGRVAVILGDGEFQSGLVWEAYLRAAVERLDRLLLVVDANGYQSTGEVATNPMVHSLLRCSAPRFCDVDGHSLEELVEAVNTFLADGITTVLYANTARGKGLPLVEANPIPMSFRPDEPTLDALEAQLVAELRQNAFGDR